MDIYFILENFEYEFQNDYNFNENYQTGPTAAANNARPGAKKVMAMNDAGEYEYYDAYEQYVYHDGKWIVQSAETQTQTGML